MQYSQDLSGLEVKACRGLKQKTNSVSHNKEIRRNAYDHMDNKEDVTGEGASGPISVTLRKSDTMECTVCAASREISL